MKDLTGYAVEMVIKYEDDAGVIQTLDTITGELVEDVEAGTKIVGAGNFEVGVEYTIALPGTTDFTLIGAADSITGTVFTATDVGEGTGTATVPVVGSGTYFNGYCRVVIDKAVTATYATRVTDTYDPFITEFRYNYHIDIIEDTNVSVANDDLRVLRGKCAVRV